LTEPPAQVKLEWILANVQRWRNRVAGNRIP
jgi:hypothetical protein